jgi:N-carbamoylputrescine amidase
MKIKTTVCELSNEPASFEKDWQSLVAHVKTEGSDLVLLPEMPFAPWVAWTDQVDPAAWQANVEAHDRWMQRLEELQSAIVVSTRAVVKNGKHLNEGFIWERESGYQAVHTKYYLPNEAGFYEASWYERGDLDFTAVQIHRINIGFLICSEIWFSEHARAYARQGVQILVCPRATPMASVGKWKAAGRVAAVNSGAFCLSSNYSNSNKQGLKWAGTGWIIEPEGGEILGLTSNDNPLLTMEIDLSVAEKAKKTYPRYIRD